MAFKDSIDGYNNACNIGERRVLYVDGNLMYTVYMIDWMYQIGICWSNEIHVDITLM